MPQLDIYLLYCQYFAGVLFLIGFIYFTKLILPYISIFVKLEEYYTFYYLELVNNLSFFHQELALGRSFFFRNIRGFNSMVNDINDELFVMEAIFVV